MDNGKVPGKKLCLGPYHPKGGELVSLNNFTYYHSGEHRGKPRVQCKDCINYKYLKNHIGQHGYIPASLVAPLFEVMEKRIGLEETRRRLGVSTQFKWRLKQQTYVTKRVAQRIIIEFRKMNESREHRHYLSIRRGAKMRGETERKPLSRYCP